MCPFAHLPNDPDGDAPDERFGDRASPVMAGLIQDCQSAGAALLNRDLPEALAKTMGIQRAASAAGLIDIQDAADGLSHAIVAASEGRPNGIGLAFDRLSRAIDRRLDQGSPQAATAPLLHNGERGCP